MFHSIAENLYRVHISLSTVFCTKFGLIKISTSWRERKSICGHRCEWKNEVRSFSLRFFLWRLLAWARQLTCYQWRVNTYGSMVRWGVAVPFVVFEFALSWKVGCGTHDSIKTRWGSTLGKNVHFLSGRQHLHTMIRLIRLKTSRTCG